MGWIRLKTSRAKRFLSRQNRLIT